MPLLDVVPSSKIAERLNAADFTIYAKSTRTGSAENNPTDNQIETELAAQIDKTGVLESAQNRVEMAVAKAIKHISDDQKQQLLTDARKKTAAGIISDFAVVGMRRSRTTSSKVRDAGGDEDASSMERTAEKTLQELIDDLSEDASGLRPSGSFVSAKRASSSEKTIVTF